MKNFDMQFQNILEKAENGIPLNREDCRYLLHLDEKSLEAGVLRATAASIIRSKNENSAIILGQIGVDVKPCSGGCRFCTFGEKHTHFNCVRMSEEEYLKSVELARKIAPPTTQIWANVGDTTLEGYQALHEAGVTGIYHVCRLREGIDTDLRPEDRIKSMHNALEAGLELYTCCEPIGPEHSVDELVDNIFIGIEMDIYQHAAMRRVAVPGAPLAHYGQISELRLAQIVAVIALASATVPTMAYMGAHEPNELCYTAGANIITAESGANPRDNSSMPLPPSGGAASKPPSTHF